LSISDYSGSIGIYVLKKGEKVYFLSAKGDEGGCQSLADMSAKKSSFYFDDLPLNGKAVLAAKKKLLLPSENFRGNYCSEDG